MFKQLYFKKDFKTSRKRKEKPAGLAASSKQRVAISEQELLGIWTEGQLFGIGTKGRLLVPDFDTLSLPFAT